jgi:4'-phosphopantetheinyl transferase
MPLHPVILSVPPEIQAAKGRHKVQALSRLARQAAQLSARRTLGRPLPDFPKDGDGVPLPMDGVHWSLSHKSTLVAGIVAQRPVGIDVEFRRPVKPGMHARIAAPREWGLAKTGGHASDARLPEPLFYRYWTAKEAVLKGVGQGLVGLSRCRVTALPSDWRASLTYGTDPWEVVQRWYGHHLVAVAFQGAPAQFCDVHWPEMVATDVNIT